MQTSSSNSPTPLPIIARDNEEENQQPSKISAYYSLVFPHFTFYIQTLSVTIGRRCSPPAQPSASSSTASSDPVQVDVDLGALKSVSRLHAKIEYDQDQDRFVLQVVGRNGAWVDGVWQGSGTRAPLGERSQIQIASRIFHFVLPPPPPPADSPSPPSEDLVSDSPATVTTSTNASNQRVRSPSLDITSISPPDSLPESDPPGDPLSESKQSTPPPPRPRAIPMVSGKSKTSKKRKKRDSESTTIDILSPEPSQLSAQPLPRAGSSAKQSKSEESKPALKPGEEIPVKPTLTYAQLIFRAIKALNGKATLTEICDWIAAEFGYYRYVERNTWASSIRHNLSSGRAFKKMERCGGERGKGFFWSLDEAHVHMLEEQDARLLMNAAAKKGGKDKSKVLEPPLKRSVKGDTKGAPLPPPLTNTPLPLPTANKTTQANLVKSSKTTQEKAPVGQTGVFAYPGTGYATHPHSTLSQSNPYAVLTQPPWSMHGKFPYGSPPQMPQMVKSVSPRPRNPTFAAAVPVASSTASAPPAQSQQSSSVPTPPLQQPLPPPPVKPGSSSGTPEHVPPQAVALPSIPPALETVIVPIVISPPTTNPPKAPMLLQDSKIILDPSIFSDLTSDMLSALEKLGARQAIHVLTGHMTRVLKEREKRGKGKKKDKEGKKRDKDKSRKKDKDRMAVDVTGPNTGAVGTETAPTPISRPESPIIEVDDDEDHGPATKRRKIASDSGIGGSLPVQVPGLKAVSAAS
ncbi:hypothetical protein E1B28_004621 [Marasmius oreades]|uniref:Uncharacterized protein n=1 Tax=Marasmius oreades TaxID=181124 RepID=A0A9P7UYY4_9AGAR|nr:uncharacterized protein E1B28_004621 [Marasmius oreades]KAG7097255.1 hypothetical protein E1B28_004621 [Marasmius oreades]